MWSFCLYSMKSSPPDASESSDSLQLEGKIKYPLKYQPTVVQLIFDLHNYIHYKFLSFYLTSL